MDSPDQLSEAWTLQALVMSAGVVKISQATVQIGKERHAAARCGPRHWAFVVRCALAIVLVSVACSLGCSLADVSSSSAKQTRISCASDDECPPEFVCISEVEDTEVGRCVHGAALKGDGPSVEVVDKLNRSYATTGSEVTVSFRCDRPLITFPTVSVGTTANRSFAFQRESGSLSSTSSTWSYTYTVDGTEPAGPADVTVLVVDENGRWTREQIGTLFLDFTAPSLLLIEASNVYLSAGQQTVISLGFDEDLVEAPSITLHHDGASAIALSAAEYDDASATWQAIHVATGTEVEGAYNVEVASTDFAGVSGREAYSSVVHFDFQAPQVESAEITPPLAGPNDVLRVIVHLDEDTVAPVSADLVQGDLELPMVATEPIGNPLKFIYSPQDDDGEFVVRLSNLVDRAGNQASQLELIELVTLDSTAPVITSFEASASFIRRDEPFTFSFSADDDLAEPPLITFGDIELPTTSLTQTDPLTWTAEIADPSEFFGEVEQTVSVVADVIDVTGNRALRQLFAAVIDTRQPAVVATTIAPALARDGSVVVFTVYAHEPLSSLQLLPLVTGEDAVLLGEFSFTPFSQGDADPSVRVFVSEEIDAGASGTVEIAGVSMVDQVGNATTVLFDGSQPAGEAIEAVFSVDAIRPEIVPGTFSPAQTAYLTADDVVSIRFSVTEALKTPPVVRYANATAQFVGEAGGEYEFQLPMSDVVGNVDAPIEVELTDQAGNVALTNQTRLVRDAVAPSAPNIQFEPSLVRPGRTALLTLVADEPLQQNQCATLLWAPDDPGFIPTGCEGLTHTWTFAVPEGVAGDEVYRVVGATLVDVAGNEVTHVVDIPLRVDAIAPVVVDGSFAPAETIYATAGDTVTVTFDVSESLPIAPSVFLAGIALSPLADPPSSGYAYSGIVPDGVEGNYQFDIELLDEAGNRGNISAGYVVLDSSPASIIDVAFVPSIAKLGDTVSLAITTNEAIKADGMVVEFEDGTDLGFDVPNVVAGGLVRTFVLTIDESLAPGTRTISTIQLEDLAGNLSTISKAELPSSADADFLIDNQPPIVENLADTLGVFSHNSGFSVVEVTFSTAVDVLSEEIVVSVPAGEFECEASIDDDSQLVACLLDLQAVEVDEGLTQVLVEVEDTAGNKALAGSTFVVDATPPAVIGDAQVVLLPAADGPLPEVTALSVGAQVQITFQVSEILGEVPTPQSAAGVSLTAEQVNEFLYRVDGVVEEAASSGPRQIDVSLVDNHGNQQTVALVSEIIVDVENVEPVPDDSLRVFRAPWGSAETDGERRIGVEMLTALPQLAGYTLLFSDGADTTTSDEIGRGLIDGAGQLSEVSLSDGDRVHVYVVAVDAAGNLSDIGPQVISSGRWAATFGHENPLNPSANPHEAVAWPIQPIGLFPEGAATLTFDTEELALPDGSAVELLSGREWSPAHTEAGGLLPPNLRKKRLAYDPIRERLLVYGGYESDPDNDSIVANDYWTDDTYEWSEAEGWQKIAVSDPEGDGNPAPLYDDDQYLFFDSRQGAVAMFNSWQRELWHWSGKSWLRSSQAFDSLSHANYNIADAAFDVASDQWLISASLYNDASVELVHRTVDGNTEAVDVAEQRSHPGRSRSCFSASEETVLSVTYVEEGLATVHAWRDDGWELVDDADNAPVLPSLNFEVTCNQAGTLYVASAVEVSVSPLIYSLGLWSFQDGLWSDAASGPADYAPQYGDPPSLAYHEALQSLMVLVRDADGNRLFAYDGSWRSLDRASGGSLDNDYVKSVANHSTTWAMSPPVFIGANEEYERLFQPGKTWSWQGDGWQEEATNNAPDVYLTNGVYLPSIERVVFLSLPVNDGDAPSFAGDETLFFDGEAWTVPQLHDDEGDGEPKADKVESMAYDPVSQMVLAHEADVEYQGDPTFTWGFDGSSWRRLGTAPEVPSQDPRSTLVLHEERQRVWLINTSVDDYDTWENYQARTWPFRVWEFDGAAWNLLPLDDPPHRFERSLSTYDNELGEALVLTWTPSDDEKRGLFSFNGERWLQWPDADVAGDGSPVDAEYLHADGSGDVLLVGSNTSSQTWRSRHRPDSHPAFAFSFDLSEHIADDAVGSPEVSSLDVEVHAAGDAVDAAGVELSVYRYGKWEHVTEALAADTPAVLTHSYSWAELQALLVNERVYFAVRSRGPAGDGQAQIAVDYAELEVQYELAVGSQ